MLDGLKTHANSRKQRSLDIVHQVCQEQHERGSRVFSIAIIGKLSAKKGGPATQSIRNKAGGDYRALIKTWAEHTGGSTRKPATPIQPTWEAILDKIPDPAVRSIVGALIADNRKLKGKLNLLQRQTEVVIDRRTAPAPKEDAAVPPIQVLPAMCRLLDTEVVALRHAISDELMKSEGWIIEENGRVARLINDRNRTIFKVGFVTAIHKVLGSTESSHSERHPLKELPS
jgi:hypothetical protein